MVRSIHMPEWSEDNSASVYWSTAEGRHSRANARTALMLVFALPARLSNEAQTALALRMAHALSRLGLEACPPTHRLPVTFAIHEGGGRNPHVHLLISTSINDNVVRPKENWFKRFIPDRPERGGAARARFLTKLQWVYKVRELWARLANHALIAFGLPGDIDHRSHASRGLLRAPTVHLGPRLAHLAAQGVITPRIARNKRAAEENKLLAELEARIARHSHRIRQLEAESQLLEAEHRTWAEAEAKSWNEVLREHPLAGDGKDLHSAASVVVLDSIPDHGVLQHAYKNVIGSSAIEDVAGNFWNVVKPAQGIWLVRPDADTVVILGPGYAATNAIDEYGIWTTVQAARLLPFTAPVVAAHASLAGDVRALLSALGLNWTVHQLRERPVNTPRTPTARP